MKFDVLVSTIQHTHTFLQQSAIKAINKHLTIRNWLIGFYIVEFEQKGEDRAAYGEKLLSKLSDSLSDKGVSNVNERELRRYRTFYQTYAALGAVFTDENIWGTVSPVLPDSRIWGTLSPKIKSSALSLPPQKLLDQLSFSHLAELIEIEDALKRTFYEIECIKSGWSVRELKRQINSLYFERMGLSNDPDKMSQLVAKNVEKATPASLVKSHFAFEFLGISSKTMVEESDLEQAILDHLQDFLLEMGRGFCFEARQKRLLIGDEYFFIDLVMYHRILKCHVIIELKADKFNHSHLSQLNTYVNYYKKNIQEESDNPPLGILMVIDKNEPLVEYALAGIDNQLFVRKYLLELPNKEKLKDFIINEIKRQQ
jgi:predicted nuclease of restriction endonuclease-like (RecB) superfamily